nr:hypothetical protein [Angustibacter aerolatus]
MHRNQDARPIYVVATLALLAVLVVALFTRWRTTALVLVPLVWLLLLGFMLPLGAEVVPGGVRFRWPLRRVLVTPGEPEERPDGARPRPHPDGAAARRPHPALDRHAAPLDRPGPARRRPAARRAGGRRPAARAPRAGAGAPAQRRAALT